MIRKRDRDLEPLSVLIKMLLNDTVESAFLFRDRDRPVTIPSLGVLNRPTSLTVLKRPQPSLTVLNRPLDSLEQITLKDG